MNKKFNYFKLTHIITILVGIIFVSVGIFHENLWFDETYSVAICKHSFADIWNIGGNDVHPVLYYWILHIIKMIFPGCYIIAFRAFSVLGIAFIGILGYTHIRKDFGEKTGLLFSFFAFFMAEMARYANEIRMYAWTAAMVTLCAIYAYRIFKGNHTLKNWLIFFMSSLISVYMHYYGLLAAGIINLFLLIYFIKEKKYKDIRILLLQGGIQALLYLPWLLYFIKQITNVSGGFWIGFDFPNTVYELLFFPMTGTLNRGYCALIIIFVYIGIILMARKMKREEIEMESVKLAWRIVLAVIGVALVMSLVMLQFILYYRYMFALIGLFIFVVSFILAKCKSKSVVALICVVVAVLGVANNIKMFKTNYSPDNEKAVEYLKENVQADEQIIYNQIGHIVFATKLENTNQIFYDDKDWGVKAAYKAYLPQMETHTDINLSGERIWVIDDFGLTLYNSLFAENDDYTMVLCEEFAYEPYSGNTVKIVLLEKTKN